MCPFWIMIYCGTGVAHDVTNQRAHPFCHFRLKKTLEKIVKSEEFMKCDGE